MEDAYEPVKSLYEKLDEIILGLEKAKGDEFVSGRQRHIVHETAENLADKLKHHFRDIRDYLITNETKDSKQAIRFLMKYVILQDEGAPLVAGAINKFIEVLQKNKAEEIKKVDSNLMF